MIPTEQYWTRFRTAFCKALDETPKPMFTEAWSHVSKKTAFYEWTLMPSVGRHLDCRMETERMRCDYTFLNELGVPIIAVESENAHASASREVDCLCGLAAPLKVLLISCDWQKEKQKFLPEWTDIIRRHHSTVSVDGLFAIISGEWDGEEMPIYSFTLIGKDGTIIDESQHAVSPSQV